MTGNEVNETSVEGDTEQMAGAAAERTDAPGGGPEVEAAAGAAPEPKTVRKVFGRVVTNGADKTVAVSIERVVKHPVYGKYIRRTSKVLAHDRDNTCQIGDRVAITECRPLSKRKSWRVVEVIGSNGAPR